MLLLCELTLFLLLGVHVMVHQICLGRVETLTVFGLALHL